MSFRYQTSRGGLGISSSNRSARVILLAMIFFMSSVLVVVLPSERVYSATNCPNLKPSIQVVYEGRDPKTFGLSEAISSFNNYVTTVSEYVTSEVCQVQQQKGQANRNLREELTFVYRPITANPASYRPSFIYEQALTQPNVSRLLDSPWARITITQSEQPVLRGVFLWNERQFLSDQIRINGAPPLTDTPLLPIPQETMIQQLLGYAQAFYVGRLDALEQILMNKQSRADTFAAQADVQRNLPSDILWLFRNMEQSSLFEFRWSLYLVTKTTIMPESTGYVNLNKALIKQFLYSTEPKIQYSNVLDLKEIFNIDEYWIELPLS